MAAGFALGDRVIAFADGIPYEVVMPDESVAPLSLPPTPDPENPVEKPQLTPDVLPTPDNRGYIGLGQMVVSRFNGMAIRSIDDILLAQKLNPDSKYDVIEFELDNPVVVIARERIAAANLFVQKNYVITKISNLNQ